MRPGCRCNEAVLFWFNVEVSRFDSIVTVLEDNMFNLRSLDNRNSCTPPERCARDVFILFQHHRLQQCLGSVRLPTRDVNVGRQHKWTISM